MTTGERKTRQRAAIAAALERAGRPLSPQEVLRAASDHCPGLGVATVYRTVRALVEAGRLIAVDIPGESPRYEIAGKDHHDHFLCRACSRVFEVDECPVVPARLPSGFLLEGHAAVLSGLCGDCAPRARPHAAPRARTPHR